MAIDAELVAKVPFRVLAGRYGISPSALVRHKKQHLGHELVALTPARLVPRESPGSALARVETLYGGLQQLWDAAEAKREVGQMLAVARELRAAIELLAKLSGELSERPQVTVNLVTSEDWVRMRSMIVETLTPYPEARLAVANRLLALNGH